MALMVEEAGAEVENSTTDKTVGEFDVTAGTKCVNVLTATRQSVQSYTASNLRLTGWIYR